MDLDESEVGQAIAAFVESTNLNELLSSFEESVVSIDSGDPEKVNVQGKSDDLVDAVDLVDEVDPVDAVDLVDAVDPVDAVDLVDAVDPVDAVDLVDAVDPVDAVDLVDADDSNDVDDPDYVPSPSSGEEITEDLTRSQNKASSKEKKKSDVKDVTDRSQPSCSSSVFLDLIGSQNKASSKEKKKSVVKEVTDPSQPSCSSSQKKLFSIFEKKRGVKSAPKRTVEDTNENAGAPLKQKKPKQSVSESDATSDSLRAPAKSQSLKESGKIKACKFQSSWLEKKEYKDWLKKSDIQRGNNDLALCIFCNQILLAHKGVLDNHLISESHTAAKEAINTTQPITKHVKMPLFTQVARFELKILAFIAARNLPLSILDDLTPLLQNLLPRVEEVKLLNLKRTRGTKLLKCCLSDVFQKNIVEKLKKQYFSVIFDETTDKATEKQMALTCIYYDNESKSTKTSFFDLIQPQGGKATELTDAIVGCLEGYEIPVSNTAAICADTTNVNFGCENSVSVLLNTKLPYLICIKCSCHLMHLVACAAADVLPEEIEHTLHQIATHFSRSSARIANLSQIQSSLDVQVHRILSPSRTRWLALESCIRRVIEQYEALQKYFSDLVSKNTRDKTFNSINEVLQNPLTIVYLEMMSFVLSYLNGFNVLFQTDSSLLHLLKPELQTLMKGILQWYVDKKYIKPETNVFSFHHKNPMYFVKDEKNYYLGLAASESIASLQQIPELKDKLNRFYCNVLSFYIELISQLRLKFSFVLTDTLFDFISIVDPCLDLKSAIDSLGPIFKRFPFLRKTIDTQKADIEWKLYLNQNLTVSECLDINAYWQKIFEKKKKNSNLLMFPNLSEVIKFLLIMPFSNACVERVFSHVKLIKNDQRSCLGNDTLKALLHTKFGVGEDCIRFEPTQEMLMRATKDNA